MAVHVSLQRARPGEALVADLALVLLLRARGNLGAELAHHGLGRRRGLGHQVGGPGERPRGDGFNVGAGGGVVADGRVHGSSVVAAAAVVAGRGDGRAG